MSRDAKDAAATPNADSGRGFGKELLLVRQALGAGLATGAIGLVGGSIYGLIKSPRPGAFAGAVTIQSAYYGSSIFLVRKAILTELPDTQVETKTVRTLASTIAGMLSGLIASTWQQSSRLRAAALIGGLSGASQIGYDGLYAFYNRAPNKTPLLERIANSPYMPLKPVADEDYEDILKARIDRLEAEITSVEAQLDSLQRQKAQLSPNVP